MPTAVQDNPYIIGVPIDDAGLLFGRERLFDFVRDNLLQGAKVILLSGQRRIGKSSLLRQLPKVVNLTQFVFVPFDLQGATPFRGVVVQNRGGDPQSNKSQR